MQKKIDKISYLFKEITKILDENKLSHYEGEEKDWKIKLGKNTIKN